ncbi:uncharacterized protein [Nothobranchius furzeri]|uniref:LOC107394523-like protein n=1 Tax=Nothobranchius furzeri TaxID=105023 RepID=A0A8C6NTH3_NOTFU|nr:putative LOC107394523-like protein [Nothobranchius furzeri]
MGKVWFAIVAVLASLALVESLSCNNCPFGLKVLCLFKKNETCANETASVCYTGTATFPSVSSFSGFITQGCRDNNTGCETTTTSSLLGVTYSTSISCCTTNNCNSYTSAASTTAKMTFTGVVGAAILASVLGSIM